MPCQLRTCIVTKTLHKNSVNRCKWKRFLLTDNRRINDALFGGTRFAVKLCEFTEPLRKNMWARVWEIPKYSTFSLYVQKKTKYTTPVCFHLPRPWYTASRSTCIYIWLTPKQSPINSVNIYLYRLFYMPQRHSDFILPEFKLIFNRSKRSTRHISTEASRIRVTSKQKQAEYASHFLNCRSVLSNSTLKAVLFTILSLGPVP
jgi:hypothetical protein